MRISSCAARLARSAAVLAAAGLLATAVRAAAPAGWYTPGAPGGIATATDTRTGLVWQAVVDMSQYTWAGARDFCASRGPSWRVPTLKELQTIVDEGTAADTLTSIDPSAFPGTPADAFWTSSLFAGSPLLGWLVSFSGGNSYAMDVTSTAWVRCVR
jgi:Protein of unknown function (DUF1566)